VTNTTSFCRSLETSSSTLARTGETLTTAVVVALRERLARLPGRPRRRRLRDQLRDIARRCAELPTLDDRLGEEILGYDDRGLPR
jgi:antitoxin VapB